MATLRTDEFAKMTGLTKNATNDEWDAVIGTHNGGGNQDFTITLAGQTVYALRKIIVSAPNLSGIQTFQVYRGTVAAGIAMTKALPIFNGAIEFTNPTVFNDSVITVRINSVVSSPVFISAHYDYN